MGIIQGSVISKIWFFCFTNRDDPSMEFNLKTYANSKDLKNAVEKILQKGGLSNVGM